MTVGRFQVMTLLQAARANLLGLPLESAHSWGLNRAIFIAAAKRGFKGGGSGGGSAVQGRGSELERNSYFLGDDMAFKTEKGGVLLFTIGGKVQTEEEFDKRVKARFGKSFPAAWREALAYVKQFDKDILLSGSEFFRTVYRPVRDEWSEKWTTESEANDEIASEHASGERVRRPTDSGGRRTRTTAGTGSTPRPPRPRPSRGRST